MFPVRGHFHSSVNNIIKAQGHFGRSLVIPSFFKSGEVGFWYDPSDLSTLFQDSAGTIPVTGVEQPVGLMLDKSLGAKLGNELASAVDVNYNTAAAYTDLESITTLSTTKLFKAVIVISDYVSGSVKINSATIDSADYSANGTYVFYGTGSAYFSVQTRGSGFVGTIKYSLKEVTGHHATQSTAPARPVLSARYNLLSKSEDYSTQYSGWNYGHTVLTQNAITGPFGRPAWKMTEKDTGTYFQLIGWSFNNLSLVAGDSVVQTAVVKMAENKQPALEAYIPGASGVSGSIFNLETGTIVSDPTGTAEITPLNDGWYVIKRTVTVDADTSLNYRLRMNDHNGITGDNVSGMYVAGCGLYLNNNSTTEYQYTGDTQSAASDYDSDPTKFPKYLKFDGVDDHMTINGLSAPSGPITAVFGYVTEEGETAGVNQTLLDVETGPWSLRAANVHGNIQAVDGINYPTRPGDVESLSVVTFILSNTDAAIHLNGDVSLQTAMDVTTGGEVVLGAKYDGASGFLHGNLFNAVCISEQLSGPDIIKVETFVADKTGVAL